MTMSPSSLKRIIGAAALLSLAAWQPVLAVTADPNEYNWWQERGFPTVMGPVAGRACGTVKLRHFRCIIYNR
jgi:hypothetical protein